MSTQAYALADLILNLVSLGIQYDAIQARLAKAKLDGVADADVPALLQQWRDDAIADAAKAIAESGGADPAA